MDSTHQANYEWSFDSVNGQKVGMKGRWRAKGNVYWPPMKLLHFTDSHLQLVPTPASQFHVQPFWMGGNGDARVLFERLGLLARKVDAVVFTGDATHGGGKPEAAKFFDLLAMAAAGKPVFMLLGNHDVVHPEWEENFCGQAQRHGNIILKDGIYPLGDVDLLLMQAGYVTADNRVETGWDANVFPVPGVSDEWIASLDAALSENTIRPVIAATHCPSHFLPPSALGFAPYVGTGMDEYQKRVNALFDKHPRVRCLLSGHIHFNSAKVAANGRVHQSLASFAEYPCQVRIVEMTAAKVESRLINLAAESETE
jgi:hypothetical protein